MKQTLLTLCGAVAGGILGYFAFGWLLGQGFYALMLPGGLLGLGAGLAKNRSVLLAVACGLAAVALGLFTEWRFWPFKEDNGFGFFLLHVGDLKPFTLLLIGFGGVLGFWVPYRSIKPQERPVGAAGAGGNAGGNGAGVP